MREERSLFIFFSSFLFFLNFKMLAFLPFLDQIVRVKRNLKKVGNFHPNKNFPQK